MAYYKPGSPGNKLPGDQLVGRKGNDIVCSGDDLKGLTFEVRSWKKKRAKIKVVDIIHDYRAENGETRIAYRLENAAVPGEALCDPKASTAFRAALGMIPIDEIDELPTPTKDLVIPVRSELFARDGTAVEINVRWKLPQREWVHLACVDDARAKRSLVDLNTDNPARSRAAMRMFTADYCGGMPATMRGVKISWGPPNDKMREARWSETGAICLDEARLLHLEGATPTIPAGLPDRLKFGCNGNCSPSDWDARVRVCGNTDPAHMKMMVAPRTVPRCVDCPAGGCNPRAFDSFVVLP
jgi:hypothetical protein